MTELPLLADCKGAAVTTAAVSPQATGRRYRSLDLWRGIACLAVIAHHAGVYDESWLRTLTYPLEHGVTLFFVISGYCIAAAAARHDRGAGSYFGRRLRRILPPWWATIALTTLLFLALASIGRASLLIEPRLWPSSAIPAPWTLNAWQWLGNLTLTEFWRDRVVWRGGAKVLMGHSWTLGYEEQFYVIMGLLMIFMRRRQALGVAIVSACVFAVAPAVPFGVFADGRWLMFAFGTAVFYRPQTSTAPFLILAAILAAWRVPHLASALLLGGVFAAALCVLRPIDERLMRLPATGPLLACGVRCYSIYLVHYPLTKLVAHALANPSPWFTLGVTFPLCFAVSLLVAWPFHAFVERRFMPGQGVRTPKNARLFGSPGILARLSQR